jgi:hypothetical protein
MRNALLLAATMAIAAVLAAGTASADPVNSKNARIIPITCDNGQSYQIVVVAGLPGHIVGSTGNIVPVEFTFTAIDPETGEELFSETESIGQGNRVGLQDDLITCTTAPVTFVDPETGEEMTFVISVEAFLTPRGQ